MSASRTDVREWWRDEDGDLWVRCPDCHHEGMIEHEIDQSGRIDPELTCPVNCGFHGWALLVSYRPDKRDPSEEDIAKASGQR